MVFLISIPHLILSIIPAILLFWIVGILWREKKHFTSGYLIIFGILFLAIARGLDVIIEYPELLIWQWFNAPMKFFTLVANTLGDIIDSVGVFLLIQGFILTIKHQIKEETRILTLETLLPICATCKKIRKQDNSWESIEKYLQHTGAPPLTHGICPECKSEMLQKLKPH